jgi:hypothetical protein
MKKFVVFNSDGKIIRTGLCPAEMLVAQASGEDEWVMEGTASDATQKVVGLDIVDKSKKELEDDLFYERVNFDPPIMAGMTDAEIDQAILDFYLGRVDPHFWRVENYALLRRIFYPPIAEFADAQVKVAAGGHLALEGKSQLDAYTTACMAIKYRFPKI